MSVTASKLVPVLRSFPKMVHPARVALCDTFSRELSTKTKPFVVARGLQLVPPSLFMQQDAEEQAMRARGEKWIRLGVAEPDKRVAPKVLEALLEEAPAAAFNLYPERGGAEALRDAFAAYMTRRFGVKLGAGELCVVSGSKEGLSLIVQAFMNKGDVLLVPQASYPIPKNAALAREGQVYGMPLRAENGYLPDLESVPRDVLKRAKILYLNYPSNPLAVQAPREFYEKAVAWAKKHHVLIVSDLAYAEMYFDGLKPPSILEVEGAKDVAVELHSVSKTCMAADMRVGLAVGNAQAIDVLGKMKGMSSDGTSHFFQNALAEEYWDGCGYAAVNRTEYQARRDLVVKALTDVGLEFIQPQGGMFVWVKAPEGLTGRQFAKLLLGNGLSVMPGEAFGDASGVRIALTADVVTLREAGKVLRTTMTALRNATIP